MLRRWRRWGRERDEDLALYGGDAYEGNSPRAGDQTCHGRSARKRGSHDGNAREHLPLLLVLLLTGYTNTGIIGHPSLATEAKGKALLDSFSRSAEAHLALISGASRS